MKNFSIATKFILLSIVSIGALAFVGIYGVYNLRNSYDWIQNVYSTAKDLARGAEQIRLPLGQLQALSLLLVIAPNQNLRDQYQEEQKSLIKQLEDNFASWSKTENNQSFSALSKSWEQYKRALNYTAEQATSGYREAAFLNVSNAERAQYVQFLQLFHEWSSLKVEHAQKIHDAAQDSYIQTQNIAIFILIFFALVVLLFNFYTARLMVTSLYQSVDIADAIAKGDLNNRIEIKVHDEIGKLLRALEQMQLQLRQRIMEEKRITEEALRINQALDSVTTNVLIADNNLKIIYLNKSAQMLFKTESEKLQQELPHFNPDDLLNNSVDILHKNPKKHRQLLENLQSSEHARLDLNTLLIEYMVTPVINAEGVRIGYVKEFNNRTIEAATEQEINAVIHAASQGDFEQRIKVEGRSGFFRTVGESLNQIMDLNQLSLQDTMRVFAAFARGDLTQTIENEYKGAFIQLKNDANTTVAKLTEVMASIQVAAEAVNAGAEEISRGNLSLSQRTEEQAAALEETAASIEEMTGTIQQNADNARQANQLAMNARQSAQSGGEVVNTAIGAMIEIDRSSKQVAEIVTVIDEISFQTNLLALNAAVEAARAGEQGRGFAVVASEVRNLAQRSAAAAKEIKGLIQDSVGKVQEGSRLVNQSGETLQQIVNAVKRVSDIVAEIAAASQEQAAGIQQVNKAISQMDEMTQQNTSLVEQAAAASESMRNQAQQLKQHVAFFKLPQKIMVEKVPVKNIAPVLKAKLSKVGKVAEVAEIPAVRSQTERTHLVTKLTKQTSSNKVLPKTMEGSWEDF